MKACFYDDHEGEEEEREWSMKWIEIGYLRSSSSGVAGWLSVIVSPMVLPGDGPVKSRLPVAGPGM